MKVLLKRERTGKWYQERASQQLGEFQQRPGTQFLTSRRISNGNDIKLSKIRTALPSAPPAFPASDELQVATRIPSASPASASSSQVIDGNPLVTTMFASIITSVDCARRLFPANPAMLLAAVSTRPPNGYPHSSAASVVLLAEGSR